MINIYKQAINGFLVNDLTAFDSEENDHQLIYHLKKALSRYWVNSVHRNMRAGVHM